MKILFVYPAISGVGFDSYGKMGMESRNFNFTWKLRNSPLGRALIPWVRRVLKPVKKADL